MSSTGIAPGRTGVFRQLRRRHRVIRWLRIAVPIVGLAALVALGAQIVIASLGGGIGISGLRLERDRLVVDRPTLTGSLGGSGSYELVAETASAPITRGSSVDLASVTATMDFTSGASARARSAAGSLDFAARQLHTGELVELETSDGIRGQLTGGIFDFAEQTFSTEQGASFQFPDGSSLTADRMRYQAIRGAWRFERVYVRVVPKPIPVRPQEAR